MTLLRTRIHAYTRRMDGRHVRTDVKETDTHIGHFCGHAYTHTHRETFFAPALGIFFAPVRGTST